MEFKAVKTIINETTTIRSSSSSVPVKLESKQKNIGKRSLANAISFSSAHYGGDDETSIHKIRKFTIEIVLMMLEKIQGSIEEENLLLDAEILRLNTELFSQSDSVFSFSDSVGKDDYKLSRNQLPVVSGSHHPNNNNQSPGEYSSSSSVSSPRPGTAGTSAAGGRFRSRLNSVRDELFFLEDF